MNIDKEEAVFKYAAPATVFLLYYSFDKQCSRRCTGVLFKKNETYAILTCGHASMCSDLSKSIKIEFFGDIVELLPNEYTVRGENADYVDYGVYIIPANIIPQKCKILNADHLSHKKFSDGKAYLIGFPEKKDVASRSPLFSGHFRCQIPIDHIQTFPEEGVIKGIVNNIDLKEYSDDRRDDPYNLNGFSGGGWWICETNAEGRLTIRLIGLHVGSCPRVEQPYHFCSLVKNHLKLINVK